MGWSDQARKRRAYGWSHEDITKLEQAWTQGVSNDRMAEMFGYASAKTFLYAARDLHQTGIARLPRRRKGQKRLPARLAADVRGCSTDVIHRRLLAACNEQGATFIDNMLDDGVTTPGAEP